MHVQFGVTLCYLCSMIHTFVLGDTISEVITLAQLQNDPYRVRGSVGSSVPRQAQY